MARWHIPSCQVPQVNIGPDALPYCKRCGATAKLMLESIKNDAASPFLVLPPDEPLDKLHLKWPSSVSYVQDRPSRPSSRAASGAGEQRSLLLSQQTSPIYGETLAIDELRLIRLSPTDSTVDPQPIHISLETHTQSRRPEYEAVSYTWGGEDQDSTLNRPVFVGEYWDILMQTKNCWDMLGFLRPQHGFRMLWIDAICINQQNLQERDNQVAKMGQIYSDCLQVVLWLGADLVLNQPDGQPHRYRLRHLNQVSTQPGIPVDKTQQTFRGLLQRRYFTRVWVIQELLLPCRVAIPLGNSVFFADAAESSALRSAAAEDEGNDGRFVAAPWIQHMAQGELPSDTLEVMRITSRSNATDIRDKVFGILGLLPTLNLRPDYSLSWQHVAIGFIAHCIVNQHAYQLLYKAVGASGRSTALSWMPEWKTRDDWARIFDPSIQETNRGPLEKSMRECLESRGYIPGHRKLEYPVLPIKMPGTTRSKAHFGGKKPRQAPNSGSDSSSETDTTDNEAGEFKSSLVTIHGNPDLRRYPRWGKVEREPLWYDGAQVQATTGALSLNMVRVLSLSCSPMRLCRNDSYPNFSLYEMKIDNESQAVIYLMSEFALDTTVEPGDELFLLDHTDSQHPDLLSESRPHPPADYFILRPNKHISAFELVASCPCVLFLDTKSRPYPFEERLLESVRGSLYWDIVYLKRWFDGLVTSLSPFFFFLQPTQGLEIPQRVETTQSLGSYHLLPLLFATLTGQKPDSTFQNICLDLISSRFEARVYNIYGESRLMIQCGPKDWAAFTGACKPQYREYGFASSARWCRAGKDWKHLEHLHDESSQSDEQGDIFIDCSLLAIHSEMRRIADALHLSAIRESRRLGTSDEDIKRTIHQGPLKEQRYMSSSVKGFLRNTDFDFYRIYSLDCTQHRIEIV